MKKAIVFFAFAFLFFMNVSAQTSAFSHQGRLNVDSAPANGNYDFEFKLFDAASGGTQQGATLQRLNVAVANGIFTVSLDFGSTALSGADRFLNVAVRTAGSGAFTQLSPRQQVTSAPYAVRSFSAGTSDTATTATNSTQLGGVAASQYVVTTDPRMTDARTPTAGSTNYIQNGVALQSSSNFNISGNGTAGGTFSGNIVNAATQYNLEGNRVLSVAGLFNIFAGVNAGQANTTGGSNAFFGRNAGFSNTTGSNNAFFGMNAGGSNTIGDENTFFGYQAGRDAVGNSNAFFGANTGLRNTSGYQNAFFGGGAGGSNTVGGGNAFFGASAGSSNTTGVTNAFFGFSSGTSNTTGAYNTAIGMGADVASGDLLYATAIGASAVVSTSNTIVLGRSLTDNVIASNRMQVRSIPLLASGAQVCFNSAGDLLQCGASSLKWKTNVHSFNSGLDVVMRLQPISYNWKEDGRPDIGLGAEDVANVAPDFAFTNSKGEPEGVKYERLNLLLINAVKEQQTQIERQQKQIDELKKIVCALRPDATLCK